MNKDVTMSRLPLIDPANTSTPAYDLLATVRAKLGIVPNMTRAMANSPAVLKAYLAFGEALSAGRIDKRTGELIALTVAEANGCDYCRAAHTAIGGMLKISAGDLADARRALHPEPRTQQILAFAKQLVERRGHVDDADISALRGAGLDDAEIADVVGHAAINVFTNLFNSAARTDVDFPPAPLLRQVA